MRNLIKVNVENVNGVLCTTSNRVAEELGVTHKHLLEKIDNYITKFRPAELSATFYIPSNYVHPQNKQTYRNYLITEKGVAQLLGGYSAAVPRAFKLNVAYINKFEEMKNYIQNNLSTPQYLLQQAKYLVEMENRLNTIEGDMTGIKKGLTRLEHNQRRTADVQLTVIAYANMKGIKPNQYHAPSIGKKATKICKERGILIGTVVDSKYGLINTYPAEILDEIFFG